MLYYMEKKNITIEVIREWHEFWQLHKANCLIIFIHDLMIVNLVIG